METAIYEILSNPFVTLVWKILSVGWTGIGAFFLWLMTRYLNHFSRALKAIAEMQIELKLQGEAIKSHTRQIEKLEDRTWDTANGNRGRNQRRP